MSNSLPPAADSSAPGPHFLGTNTATPVKTTRW